MLGVFLIFKFIQMNNDFSTNDLGLASVLQSKGFRLLALDKSDPTRIKFCFELSPGLDEAISLHYQNELPVSSLALLSNYRSFKNMIHQN